MNTPNFASRYHVGVGLASSEAQLGSYLVEGEPLANAASDEPMRIHGNRRRNEDFMVAGIRKSPARERINFSGPQPPATFGPGPGFSRRTDCPAAGGGIPDSRRWP